MRDDSDEIRLSALLTIAERGKAAEMTRLAAAVTQAAENESMLDAARRETVACVEELSRLASVVSVSVVSARMRDAAMQTVSAKMLSACAVEAEAEAAHGLALHRLDEARMRLAEASRDLKAQSRLDDLARARLTRRRRRRTQRRTDEQATATWLASERLLDD